MENTDFLIPLTGLTPAATVSWRAGKEFFEEFGNEGILDAGLLVEARAEKRGADVDVDCRIAGSVTVVCDRCLSDLRIPVDLDLALRFGPSGEDGDGREAVRMSPESEAVDLRQVVYDYVCLSIPLRRVHPDGECDPSVTSRLSAGPGPAVGKPLETASDSPFANLKGLLKTNELK